MTSDLWQSLQVHLSKEWSKLTKINEIKHFEVVLKRKIIFILSSDEEDLDEEVSVVNLLFSILSALFN